MANGKFVSYFRVSTDQQGRSGLGVEAQRSAVEHYLSGGRWELVADYTEIESGKLSERPELQKALASCRIHGATLVVAKLDRLARNAHFLLGLKAAGIEFVCCDMPSANRLTVGIMAMVAEEETRMISERTKAALSAARAKGVKLGNPQNLTKDGRNKGSIQGNLVRNAKARARAKDLLPVIDDIRAQGVTSLRGIARALNDRGIPTARGRKWQAAQVQRVLSHVASPEPAA